MCSIAKVYKREQVLVFSCTIGHTLDRFMKDLCHEAGIEGETNHSLQATGTT